ncbi:hypothetical protein VTK73DRAFT_5553 [Phialemonium thermophilum]|uniref:Uncharacterized protein n=1 Tax=Phialemonium thermophilum TaxID=223376 RepID=A0ABR3XX05_9PEZI
MPTLWCLIHRDGPASVAKRHPIWAVRRSPRNPLSIGSATSFIAKESDNYDCQGERTIPPFVSTAHRERDVPPVQRTRSWPFDEGLQLGPSGLLGAPPPCLKAQYGQAKLSPSQKFAYMLQGVENQLLLRLCIQILESYTHSISKT